MKDEIQKYFEPLGRRSAGFYLAGSSFLIGLISQDSRLKKISFKLLEGSILSDLSVKILQKTFGRERPMKGGGDPMKFFSGGNSFPSSHSLHIWTIAKIFSQYYPNYKYLFYSIAFITSLSRVLDDFHWTSDVVFGAISGIIIGKIVHKENKNFSIFPLMEKGKYKFTLLIKLKI